MAKKKDAKKEKPTGRTEAVRAAVDQAFQATAQATVDAGQLTRGRAAEIADELVGNIGRLRDALDDARPATSDDLKALRAAVEALSERVGRLETARAAAAITGADATAEPGRSAKPKPAAPAKTGASGKRRTAPKPGAATKPKPAAPAKTGPAAKKPAA